MWSLSPKDNRDRETTVTGGRTFVRPKALVIYDFRQNFQLFSIEFVHIYLQRKKSGRFLYNNTSKMMFASIYLFLARLRRLFMTFFIYWVRIRAVATTARQSDKRIFFWICASLKLKTDTFSETQQFIKYNTGEPILTDTFLQWTTSLITSPWVGDIPIFGLYRYVARDRVWFLRFSVLNRVSFWPFLANAFLAGVVFY